MKPRVLFCLLIGALLLANITRAVAPALRDELSLNGDWPVGGPVPIYTGIAGLDERAYERDVAVPAAWRGRVIKLEFGAVNFLAAIAIDGVPVAEHVGGWMPFAVDVSKHVQPGKTFRLRVVVRGPKHAPIVDENGAVAWPVGGWQNRGGIADDVWLRAYGDVHVEDAFIRPSAGARKLRIDYTLRNASDAPRTVTLRATATAERGDRSEWEHHSPPLMLAAGETREVTVEQEWSEPTLYWPDAPAMYLLRTTLEESGRKLDRETRRFGFREIDIRGNQFFWNGIRVNLFGDYQVFGDTWYLDSATLHTPENWPGTVARMKAMNVRVLRWHHNPVPRYLLDVCDEQGLLVCSEAANYGRDFHRRTDKARYVANAVQTIGPWIRAERNHPSIYLWNATNEMTHRFTGPFAPDEMLKLGREVARWDPTRPVGYDGDTGRSNAALQTNVTPENLTVNRIRDATLVDYHYPEGYNREPIGSIYDWARLVFPDRPTGAGELLHTKSPDRTLQETMERNTWWLGVWLRGLRYTNWTNVKPACWWFTDADLASDDSARRLRTINLRNALAPVALFDKDYDDLGVAPYVTGTRAGGELPRWSAGSRMRRTLVLYNDEFCGTEIMIEVALVAGEREIVATRKSVELALGEHCEIPYSLTLPGSATGEFALRLRTFKGGQQKFEEFRRFNVMPEPNKKPEKPEINLEDPGVEVPAGSIAWRPLLDDALSLWEKFIGVPHGSIGLASVPAESDGMHGEPLGLGRDPLNVFSVVRRDGEPVLLVSGQVYGGLTTRESFANYHLRLQVRWGEKKWPPRATQRRDSGLLYHATGTHGAFWSVWKRSIEFQIEETNMGDLYALAGSAAMVPASLRGKYWTYDPDGRSQRIVTGEGTPIFVARHRPGNFEKPHGEWNDLELIVFGCTAVHIVNGEVVLVASDLGTVGKDGSESPLTGGQIQLQSEGAEVEFRRVEIRPIAALPPRFAWVTAAAR